MATSLYYKDEWQQDDLFRFYLIGADHKTRWVFGGEGSPVRLASTPEGLQGAPFEHDFQEIVGMPGALYRGTTDKQLSVTLKVWFADPRSSAWARRQHSMWRDSLERGKKECRLYCISKENGYWWADLRTSSIQQVDYHDAYPGEVGEIGETIVFTSDNAFFERFEETRTFDRDTCRTAALVNLGTEPAWLRWTVTGTHDGVELGVDGEAIALPGVTDETMGVLVDYPLMEHENRFPGYYIDTDEVWPNLLSTSGTDIQDLLPDAFWTKPLPARGRHRGVEIPLTINPINPGSDFRVDVAYTPRMEQPW